MLDNFISWQELIGYLAPVFVVLSMMQSNVKKIRWLMIGGCLTFVIYGTLVQAWPVVVANALIGIVTAYYLFISRDVKREFSLLNAKQTFPDLIYRFTETHNQDLTRRFPNIQESLQFERTTVLFFMHELEPVGMFSYRKIEQGVVEILVDYVIPEYRDDRTDKYLYCSNEGHLIKEGFQKVIMHTEISSVKEEMRTFGFEEQEPGILIKVIS
ncbi:MAG: hypothetical protein K940chlam3_00283 [Chlamydiae bacterium]|nr:hypothetical protein [Chlamydiota bacterium]